MWVDFLIGITFTVMALFTDGEGNPDTKYIEYLPGDTNLIFTVPHDGHLTPDTIPDRVPGCKDDQGVCHFPADPNCPEDRICKVVVIPDGNTFNMAKTVREVFIQRTGKTPHLIVNRLHRSKLDANRDIENAAQNSREAQEAWREFHDSINKAKESIGGEPALLLDFHRQRHGLQTTELGYVYTKSELNEGNLASLGPVSSISSLLSRHGLSPEEMMSGEGSLGAAWEQAGYKAVPSPRQAKPGTDVYYRGGYITQTHGSRDGGNVDAIQMEFPKELITDGDDPAEMLITFKGETFANKIGDVITNFHNKYYS